MVGKLERYGQGFYPIFHMIPMVYASGAFALRKSNIFFYSTHKGYRKLIRKTTSKREHEEDTREI